VQWGSKKNRGVEIGFCRGNLLSDPSYLNIANRKQVYIKTFYSTKEIDTEKLRQLLYEAVVIDEEEYKKKEKAEVNTCSIFD